MTPDELFARYRELQEYVGWTDDDAHRVASTAPLLEGALHLLVDDFYEEIHRHPGASKVITGGREQVERLKGTLIGWLRELLSGRYDVDYVARRWRVGWRHVEIGLDQVYTNVALSRLRTGLLRGLDASWTGGPAEFRLTARALNKLLDLDLAIIEDAYQAEHMLRQQRSERLAAIGQVSAGVAHELRNPLNVVKTSVYYLLNAHNPTPEKTSEHLQRIGKHVDLADGVITTLSRFAKLPAPDLKPSTVEQCVRDALEINPVSAAIRVALDFPPGQPPALVDRDQILIVFGNLIRNARDAMPQGGTLTIASRADSDAVEVDVTDTGVGMAPDVQSRISEPLYSTKARGLGLGLSIARSILEKSGGAMRVSSTPGKGSTFTVRLKVAVGAEPSAQKEVTR
jgi:signal transduction histidine kinase